MQDGTRVGQLLGGGWVTHSPTPSSKSMNESFKEKGQARKLTNGHSSWQCSSPTSIASSCNGLVNKSNSSYDAEQGKGSGHAGAVLNRLGGLIGGENGWVPWLSKSPHSAQQSAESPLFERANPFPQLSAKLGLTRDPKNGLTSSRDQSFLPRLCEASTRLAPVPTTTTLNRQPHRVATKPSETIQRIRLGEALSPKGCVVSSVLKGGASDNPLPISRIPSILRPTTTLTPCRPQPNMSLTHQVPPTEVGQGTSPRMLSFSQRRRTMLHSSCTLPNAAEKARTLLCDRYAYYRDFFPLGLGPDDSDGSDAEGSWTGQQNSVDPSALGGQPLTPHQRNVVLLAERRWERRQLEATRHRTEVLSWDESLHNSVTRCLIESARSHPRLTAAICASGRGIVTVGKSTGVNKERNKSSLLQLRTCDHPLPQEGEGPSIPCGGSALPGTRHCLSHVTANAGQQLFAPCSARHADNTLCRAPTFDPTHQLPLCAEHSRKRDNYIRLYNEDGPTKPKPRKKSKMPVFSRTGRSRKRKRPTTAGAGSSVVPSTRVRPPVASQPSQPPTPQPQQSPFFSSASYTTDSGDDDELEEEELEGIMGGGSLPLDAASRLLDPHDLQDVLCRIPDHELNQLFDATEVKPFDLTDKEGMEEGVGASGGGAGMGMDDPGYGAIPLEFISESFNQQELNAISQALCHIGYDLPGGIGSFPGDCESTPPHTPLPTYLDETAAAGTLATLCKGGSPLLVSNSAVP